MTRANSKANSNNPDNPCKNICGLAVAKELGVDSSVHYLHRVQDLVRAARTRYTVRSRMSSVRAKTVGSIRKELDNLSEKQYDNGSKIVFGYLIRVDRHVLLLNEHGRTIVDTDQRKRDRRMVTHLYIVYKD